MKFLMLALLATALPSVQSHTCLECYCPGRPLSSFVVCQGVSGHTIVEFNNGRWAGEIRNRATDSIPVGVGGARIHPAHPKKWGDVSDCSDIHCEC